MNKNLRQGLVVTPRQLINIALKRLKEELEEVFRSRQLEVVDYDEKVDEFGKVWMDYIVRTQP